MVANVIMIKIIIQSNSSCQGETENCKQGRTVPQPQKLMQPKVSSLKDWRKGKD
jgi:hypothetical protein